MRGYNDGYDVCSNNNCSSDSGDFCRHSGGLENAYYNGFVAGCLSVKGNTAEICEQAT
jgi:hypothetical protein